MGYTSFSENKVSRNLVLEYVIYNIMKYRESRFLEVSTARQLRVRRCSDCESLADKYECSDCAQPPPFPTFHPLLTNSALSTPIVHVFHLADGEQAAEHAGQGVWHDDGV